MFHEFSDGATFRGKVQRSMVAGIREVEVTIRNGKITESFCPCPNGQFTPCSHKGTLLLYIHGNVSCTDTAAKWSKRTLLAQQETQTLAEMIKASKIEEINDEKKKEIREYCRNALRETSLTVPCVWLLKPEPSADVHCAHGSETDDTATELKGIDLEDIVLSVEFAVWDDKRAVLRECCEVNSEEIERIAKETLGQWSNHLFIRMKKFRLTASNFGFILAAINRNSFPKSHFQRVLGLSNLEKVKAIQHGRQYEDVAFSLLKNYNVTRHVQKAGMYLHKSGLLGASPDAISETCVVEIKCPYKYCKSDLREVLTEGEKYVVHVDAAGNIILNENHEYYHQVQAQLHFCQKNIGYLLLWTFKSHLLLKIEKNNAWAENINLLLDYYFSVYIPHILSNIV